MRSLIYASTSGLAVIPSGAPLGAEIVGVDLSEEIDDQTFHAIDAAYNEHIVIVFRDQQLTPAQHLRFARRFGELEISPRTQFALPGYPEILLLSNILDGNGQPIGNADAGRTWHTDLSYTATPPRGSLLYAVEVPTTNRGRRWARPCSSALPLPMTRFPRQGNSSYMAYVPFTVRVPNSMPQVASLRTRSRTCPTSSIR